MMRIAVKWCQEMIVVFDKTQERKDKFRMIDGK